ncbi:hypothetical protein GCM10010833_17970 [Blastomonas aquatica]|uniref:Uncharacterized protein n=1 Tax=Blastomonas aquatica TaxID=1510276 RepID=A0ABQ1J9T5_9SPHN|nr:hypothetical protein GCM10010833_17970 [Blastomonas aquatica]
MVDDSGEVGVLEIDPAREIMGMAFKPAVERDDIGRDHPERLESLAGQVQAWQHCTGDSLLLLAAIIAMGRGPA